MNEQLLAKCSCTHCKTHLEFPLELAGSQIVCPHCGKHTELSLTARPPEAAGRPTPGEILAAFARPIPRTRVSFFYQVALVLVAVMMVLLPVCYLALIATLAWGVYRYATHFSWMVSSLRFGLLLFSILLIIYVTPIFLGCVLVFFMTKPLFARSVPRAQPLAMNPALEPVLFTFISKISDLVGAPMPRRIDLDCDLNAAAGFRFGAPSLFGNDLVLTIGLPLVANLSLREFAGIVAHEFGHFSQGFGMRLSYVIRTVNTWFARLVFQRDEWDVWLEQYGMEAEEWFSLIVFNVARLAIAFSRFLLRSLMLVGHAVSCFLLRQMEYDADSYEIKIAGSASFESATRRATELGEAIHRAYKDLRTSWTMNRRLPEDFPAFLVQQHAKLPPAVCARLQATLGLGRTRWFDSHPSEGDRIRQARQAQAPGVFRLDLPASVLFTHFEVVCKQITFLHYTEDLGIDVHPENLRPIKPPPLASA